MFYSRARPRSQKSAEHLLRAGPRRHWAQTCRDALRRGPRNIANGNRSCSYAIRQHIDRELIGLQLADGRTQRAERRRLRGGPWGGRGRRHRRCPTRWTGQARNARRAPPLLRHPSLCWRTAPRESTRRARRRRKLPPTRWRTPRGRALQGVSTATACAAPVSGGELKPPWRGGCEAARKAATRAIKNLLRRLSSTMQLDTSDAMPVRVDKMTM